MDKIHDFDHFIFSLLMGKNHLKVIKFILLKEKLGKFIYLDDLNIYCEDLKSFLGWLNETLEKSGVDSINNDIFKNRLLIIRTKSGSFGSGDYAIFGKDTYAQVNIKLRRGLSFESEIKRVNRRVRTIRNRIERTKSDEKMMELLEKERFYSRLARLFKRVNKKTMNQSLKNEMRKLFERYEKIFL